MRCRIHLITASCLLFACVPAGAEEPTYAERLGWAPGERVVVIHIDDAGMSHSSNRGSKRALDEGVATSVSTMMPCPWVPEWNAYLKANPGVDNGIHLTMTSEWTNYRWGPVAGKAAVPGLVDPDGYLWGDVGDVVQHASPDEVETEIRAQIERAESMGMTITHIDSHMGTLFASPLFFQRYLAVGAEKGIPVLVIGGHLQYLSEDMPVPVAIARQMGRTAWDAGLPVIDDLHTTSYGWKREEKTDRFIEVIRGMRPGILEIIVHATEPTEEFDDISGSGETRLGDMEAMIDPRLRAAIEEEGIILSTWRELMERRRQVGR